MPASDSAGDSPPDPAEPQAADSPPDEAGTPDEPPPDEAGPPETKGRVRRTASEWRRLATIAYRDPEHVAERLTRFGSLRLGEESVEWATRIREERPDASRAVVAEEVRTQTAQVARIDGAVSGTPFLIALVPGYLAYLWQEGVMERRMAALYGHDPRSLETSAQILVLRGVHTHADSARAALERVWDAPPPEKPTSRRSLRTWFNSVYTLLVFGGFLSPTEESEKDEHWRLKAAAGFAIGGVIWVITWVLPVSFMIAMAWGCESHARSLGHRTMTFYGGEDEIAEAATAAGGAGEKAGRTRRDIIRAALLALSIAIPIGFVAYADHVRNTTGVNWLGALGALVAASLVIATTVIARRR
ncbi:MAG: hypothetical protein U0R70_15735 [Solirubrobacteraceae bacterium]